MAGAGTPDPAVPSTWAHRHLLDVDVLSAAELETVMTLAGELARARAAGSAAGPLAGRTVATLFAEASTRTRVSFEVATPAQRGEAGSLDAASSSLSKVEDLDMRLCLSGHGRTFTDVAAHITANRLIVAERLESCIRVLDESGPITAFDAVPLVYGSAITAANANWWLSETLCYLQHLEVTGRAERLPGDDDEPERWRLAG